MRDGAVVSVALCGGRCLWHILCMTVVLVVDPDVGVAGPPGTVKRCPRLVGVAGLDNVVHMALGCSCLRYAYGTVVDRIWICCIVHRNGVGPWVMQMQ